MALTNFVSSYPAIFIIVASLVLSILITLVYKFTTNQHEMKRLRDELKSLQGKVKEHKGDSAKMMDIQKELASKNMEYMKHSFKPMLYTFIPIILIFGWLSGLYKNIDTVMTISGINFNWIWTYIIFSLIFSFAIRKFFKVH